MKNNLQTNPMLLRLTVLVACFMLAIVYNKSKASEIPDTLHSNNPVVVKFSTGLNKIELTPGK